MKKAVWAVMLLVGALAMVFAQNQNQMQGHTSKAYVEYSEEAFKAATEQKRVLFFAASWCPSCRGADADINAKLKQIPEGLVIFKTDYDKEAALKTKYGIVRQHTFVYVDAKGNALKKWSGGGLAEIVANTK